MPKPKRKKQKTKKKTTKQVEVERLNNELTEHVNLLPSKADVEIVKAKEEQEIEIQQIKQEPKGKEELNEDSGGGFDLPIEQMNLAITEDAKKAKKEVIVIDSNDDTEDESDSIVEEIDEADDIDEYDAKAHRQRVHDDCKRAVDEYNAAQDDVEEEDEEQEDCKQEDPVEFILKNGVAAMVGYLAFTMCRSLIDNIFI